MQNVNVLSKVLLVVGAGLLIAGIIRFATLPAEKPTPSLIHSTHEEFERGSHESMDSFEARGSAQFLGFALTAFGAVTLFGGLGLSRRGRAMAMEIQQQNATALTRGVVEGLGGDAASRLTKLEELHRQGLLKPDEYEAKRKEIIAKL